MRQALGHGNTLAVIVNRDGRLMAVLSGPDNVLRSPGRVAAEENALARALHGLLVHHGHVPFVELDSDIALDPRKRVLLPDRENHVVGGQKDRIDGRGFLGAFVPLQALELHADELSVFDYKTQRRMVDEDLDVFLFGVLQFPGRSFEETARPARHHLDVLAAQPAGRPAAIHRRVADADDQHLFADRIGVSEGDGFQPIDADVNAIGIVAARQIQLFTARRAGADKDRIEIFGRAAPSCSRSACYSGCRRQS